MIHKHHKIIYFVVVWIIQMSFFRLLPLDIKVKKMVYIPIHLVSSMMVVGLTAREMEKENNIGQMEQSIKESLKMINVRVQESLQPKMARIITVNFLIIWYRGMEVLLKVTDLSIQGNGKKINKVAMELNYGKIIVSMKVIFLIFLFKNFYKMENF